jgi:DnaB-like helicase C terminal domain
VTGKKPLNEKIRDAAQEFRDPEIEYQLMAYLVRINPSMSGMMKSIWINDIILVDVFKVVNDLRIVLSAAMLLNELKERGLIGSDAGEEELYGESINQLFSIDITSFNEKNARHMMTQILRLAESRKVLLGCGDIVSSMRNFNLEDAKRKLLILSRPESLVDHQNAGFYLDDYEERKELLDNRREEAEENEDFETGVTTGIYRFDRAVGGIMRKEFGVIAGITGIGKTAALVSFGLNAYLHGHDVMIVSGEMSKDLIEFRIDSYLTRIPGMKFRTAELTEEDSRKWDSVIKLYQAKQDNYLYIASYPRRFNIGNVERDMIRLQEETGRKASVVCLDYINIMDPIRGGGKDGNWKDQAEAVWDFKGFISEYNLVGWTAGQVKDEAYGKDLYDLQDLKYARAISECSPVVAALIRTEKDRIENRMKLQILKMRNAGLPRRPILLTPNLDIMRIHEDISEKKTLRGKQADTIDKELSDRASRPRKKLGDR